jgi:transcriptional regulator
MYIPTANAETDPDTLFAFITQSPLGALVTMDAGGEMVATHLPWLVDRARGEHGVLEGHIARANSQHASHEGWGKGLVIFTGPDAYITPSWYAAKAEHGKVVPTWNYVAVHVYGRVRFTSEQAFLARHLERLVARHESARPAPWAIGDAPAEYIARQMKAIVGVELVIERIEGKWKMSQNRSAADVNGVIEGLGASADPTARAVGEIMKRLSVEG